MARDSAACCIFNGKYIYVFSGRIKFNPKEITDVCELYDIDKKVWEKINLSKRKNWIPCDLAMCYQISSTNILIFGGFDRQNRTNATFVFNTTKNTIEKSTDLPTVGSFSTMVFHIDESLYTVGWNNTKKNLYKYSITKGAWSLDEDFTI